MRNMLVGYIRKDKTNSISLRLSIDKEAFNKAATFESRDGRNFVTLICNADKVKQIIEGSREVTSLCQILEEEKLVATRKLPGEE